ncbi:MAG: hypothetical protein JXB07_14545 [Anaerolineae bacterium]|nr:hypothetical protein [Anaerolineae bacterium]
MSRYFPFHELGLRSNPFRALTDSEWADIVILSSELLSLASQPTHLQILGPMGAGKTSSLLGLAAHFRRLGQYTTYTYIPDGQTTFAAPPETTHIFLLDEAQRLHQQEIKRLLTCPYRLIIASHADLAADFARAGQPLATQCLGPVDTQQLHDLLKKRLDYFARPEGAHLGFSLEAVDYLRQAGAGNLRFIESWLYEFIQRQPPTGIIQPAALIDSRPHTMPAPTFNDR